MDERGEHIHLNPKSKGDWSTEFTERSKDIDLAALAGQDMQYLNQVLELATRCVACLEEHIGYTLDELMPEFEMCIEDTLEDVKCRFFSIKENGLEKPGPNRRTQDFLEWIKGQPHNYEMIQGLIVAWTRLMGTNREIFEKLYDVNMLANAMDQIKKDRRIALRGSAPAQESTD